MRLLIKILGLVLFVALVLVAISFLSANPEPYQLRFLDWNLIQSTVGILILLAFVLGALVGLLVGMPLILGLRRQIKKMQKNLSQAQGNSESASHN